MDDITEAYNATEAQPKHVKSAETAKLVLEHYVTLVGGSGEPTETTLSDLLADLMHYAASTPDDDDEDAEDESVDFEGALTTAYSNFEAETPDVAA